MSVSRVSAVLYARDHRKVAAFYRDTLGVAFCSGDEDHAILACGGFDLIIHQIPESTSDSPANAAPPKRRENAAIRLNFTVDSIAAAQAAALSQGGKVDGEPPRWAPFGSSIRVGHDPEGNVFTLEERAQVS